MVFLILLVVAWGIVVLPRAREHHWSRPMVSTRRYRWSMKMVAPVTRWEVRRASMRSDEARRKVRERRMEVITFLAAAAAAAALAGFLSDSSMAWPTCATATSLLMMYVAAIVESDRRRMQRRIAARRAGRVALERTAEAERASAPEYAEAV